MKSASLYCIPLLLAVAESYSVTNHVRTSACRPFTTTPLSVHSPSPGGSTHNMHSSSGWGFRSGGSSAGVPSKTACESAVNVEWEPMSELDRRIEDGIHYEHMPNNRVQSEQRQQERRRMPGCHSKAKRIEDGSDREAVRAVFCAYRYTTDDYNRLKSANIS